jgi:peptidylprolyl isomerase
MMTIKWGTSWVLALAFVGCGRAPEAPEPTPSVLPPTKAEAGAAAAAKNKAKKRRPVKAIKGALPAPPDVAAPPADVERTESGLASRVLKKGRGGPTPGPYDAVTVHYSGWTTDGINFDSSVVRGEPSEFRLNQVIKGWTEGLQLMKKGEKRRFWVPEELAYKGRPGRPQGMLVFDVELLDVDRAPPLPPPPDDVAGPPAEAEKSASGLAWRILRKGRGNKTPSPTSRVKIKFTGWTTDGRLFRSTILEGRPAVMPLDRISSKGLSEGLQMMKRGEKRRLWIPPELAYKGTPGAPEGMIVMDLEMLKIMD